MSQDKRRGKEKTDWMVVELVRNLLISHIQFKKIYRSYTQGSLTFQEVAQFIDDKKNHLPLFSLKEVSHALFRSPKGYPCKDEERLFDLAIGSIFHEAMKVRENLYQLEVYRPRYMQMKDRLSSTLQDRRLLEEFTKIGERAERRLREGILEMRRLFEETLAHLQWLLPYYRERNPLLLRLFFQRFDLFREAYGPKRIKGLIRTLFPEGMAAAYKAGGASFLEGEHFQEAERFFRQAMKYDPEDDRARFLYFYCRGFNAFYQNRYSQCLRCFRRALRQLPDQVKGLEEFLEKMAEASMRIGREFLEEKKRRAAKGAMELSERIRLSLMGKEAPQGV